MVSDLKGEDMTHETKFHARSRSLLYSLFLVGAVPLGATACAVGDFGEATEVEEIEGPGASNGKFMYVVAVNSGDEVNPDFLATVDIHPNSRTYGQIVSRLDMPEVGDNLHHFGYSLDQERLLVPGMFSSRMHVVDVTNAKAPSMSSSYNDLVADSGYVSPHTVTPIGGGLNLISMLGSDNPTSGPAGLVLVDDETGEFVRHYGPGPDRMSTTDPAYTYDLAIKLELDRMVSTAWGWPDNVFQFPYAPTGSTVTIWDFTGEKLLQTVDLGIQAAPLEADWLHDSNSTIGYAIAANGLWMWEDEDHNDIYNFHNLIPGDQFSTFACDMTISEDDRFLYVSAWPDSVKQYDITVPHAPVLVAEELVPHPCMMRLSPDNKTLYVTNSVMGSLDDDPLLGSQNFDYGIYKFDVHPNGGFTSATGDGSAWVDFSDVQKKHNRGPAGPHMIVFDSRVPIEVGHH